MLEVWWTDAAGVPSASSLALLSPEELARLERLRRPRDRAEYATAHVLLRHVLASRLGTEQIRMGRRPCPCCGAAHGRPFVASPETGLEVSLAHGAGVVAVALCLDGPVGVDVERVDAPLDGAEHRLHPVERRELDDVPADQRAGAFTRTWVRKEAYLKAIGTGLRRDTRLDYVAPGRLELQPPGWAFHELDVGPLARAAVCAPVRAGAPVVRRASLQTAPDRARRHG